MHLSAYIERRGFDVTEERFTIDDDGVMQYDSSGRHRGWWVWSPDENDCMEPLYMINPSPEGEWTLSDRGDNYRTASGRTFDTESLKKFFKNKHGETK